MKKREVCALSLRSLWAYDPVWVLSRARIIVKKEKKETGKGKSVGTAVRVFWVYDPLWVECWEPIRVSEKNRMGEEGEGVGADVSKFVGV